MTLIGEPFVTDRRLEKVENRVRQAIPDLPEDARFATYIQERFWTNIEGLDREIPQTAIFLITSPNPRHPNFTLNDTGGELFENWRMREKAYDRHPGQTDPLIPHFMQVAKAHVSKIRNLKAISN